MRTIVPLIGALVLGMACGFLAGRNAATRSAQAPSNLKASELPQQSRQSIRPAPSISPSLDTNNLAEQLHKLNSVSWRKKWEQARDLARSISPRDSSNALVIAEKILPRQEWYNFRYQVLQKWAEADPLAVLAYGQSLKNRSDRQQAISQALQEWAKRDPDAALAWVDRQPRGQERQNFLGSALQGLAEGDPNKALEKLNGAPVYQRRWIRDQIINTLAESDPKQAAELALKSDRSSSRYGYGFPGDAALGNVLQKWMTQDADAALGWLQSQPEN